MGISPFFVTKNIFKAYFPHFVPRGTSNNLQMLNTKNLPTHFVEIHSFFSSFFCLCLSSPLSHTLSLSCPPGQDLNSVLGEVGGFPHLHG